MIKKGNLSKIVRPDGSVEEKTYDDSNNLIKSIDKTSSGAILQSYEYTYDSYGNILSIKEAKLEKSTDLDADSKKAVDLRQSDGYSYYINEACGYNSEEEIEYIDESDELKYVSSEMEYDAANRLIKYNGEEVKYDADGNMIYGPLNGSMVEFSYDARNRLTSAGNTKYYYDAENYRYKVETSDYTEEYVTDKVYIISRTLQIIRTKKTESEEKTTANDSIVMNYYYGTGLLYDKCSDNVRLYHFNHLGNTTLITDKSGNSVYRSAYGTYGELLYICDIQNSKKISLDEISINQTIRFLYNGELGVITDDNTLLYMRQRYYNPEIKRFINQDVLSGNIENSQSLNRYCYVEGNPVCYTDPFGLSKLVDTLRTINSVYNVIQDAISELDTHTVLDILGLVPVIGPFFDACNAVKYAFEGDWKNFATSIIFMIPGSDLVGTAAKISTKLGKSGKYVNTAAKFIKLLGTATATGISAYTTGKNIADLIDTYATEGKEIDANFYLKLGEIGFGITMTASFGKTLADDLNKYTSLEEKLEKAVEKIKKEAARVVKDNSNQIKKPSDRKNKKTRASGRNDSSYKNQNNTDDKKVKFWDYSKQFDKELSNFNDGYVIKNVVEKDIYLVQFHSGAKVGEGRSLKYWTTIDQANDISTIDDYMNKMALLSEWGDRDYVSIAKVPAGTKIKYAEGTARPQSNDIETRPGNGIQLLFEKFYDGWVIETRQLP